MKYVIIGNSVAGVACAETIAKTDTKGSITIISEEKYPAYGRPLISYFLGGEVTEENMPYRPADFCKANGIKVMLKKRALKIDSKAKTVVLNDGTVVAYDKLLVATGSRPFVPPCEGLEKVKNSFTFMTLDDAKAIKKTLKKNSRVLIVGAGLIGLKCAEGASAITENITVIDLADRVLSSVLDSEGSKIMEAALRRAGIEVILGDSAVKYTENSCITAAGKRIDFDVLITAVGVRPNTSLVAEAGGKVDRGIVTDDGQRTSLPDVFAAGDCTLSHDFSSNTDKIMAIMPNAYFQGETAGINMCGGDAHLTNLVPMNAIGFFGVHMLSAGSCTGESLTVNSGSAYKKFFTDGGKLRGYIMIGGYDRAGIVTSLIRDGVNLSQTDLQSLIEEPRLAAFSDELRRAKLAK